MSQVKARVRVLTWQDLPLVVPLENAAYDFPWTEAIFRDCFQAGYTGLALECGEEFLGYGMLCAAAGEAHILNVVIAPAARGLGLGKKLVQRLLDQARWHRVDRVLLEVRESNVAARSLYAKLKFQEVGRRKAYYPGRQMREDAIVMALTLIAPVLTAPAV
jgi:[ribosomal protein S18]-alanine N-acetyltransferase